MEIKIPKEALPKEVRDKMHRLNVAGFEAYVVGGAIRDILLQKEPHDFDIFTDATGEDILGLFPNGKVIGGEERQEKILTVIVDGIEISQFRRSSDRKEVGKSLADHVATCDFTINSMACNAGGEIFDFEEGYEDIQGRVLRFVGKPKDRIEEDPLRIMRAVRFKQKYNLHYETETLNAIIDLSGKLKDLPPERKRDELLKVISATNDFGNILNSITIMVLPELIELRRIPGGHYHAENNFVHAIETYRNCAENTNDSLLRFVALLHDIGKIDTYEDGHFYQHERVGEEKIEEIMERLKFSNIQIRYAKTLVRNHMWNKTENITKKSYIKHFKDLDDNSVPIEDFVLLLYSDFQGNLLNPRIKFGDFLRENDLIQMYWGLKYSREPFSIKDLEIDGKDVMNMTGKNGVEVGNVLKKIFEEVMDGKLVNRCDRLLERLKMEVE